MKKNRKFIAKFAMLMMMLAQIISPLTILADEQANRIENEKIQGNETTTSTTEVYIEDKSGSLEEPSNSKESSDSSDTKQLNEDPETSISQDTSEEFEDTTGTNLDDRSEEISLFSTLPGRNTISSIFPDANLAKIISNTLGYGGVTSVRVTQNQLNTITTVSADSVIVSSIEGVQYLNNVTSISFQNSQNITTLAPLANAGLSKLKYFYLKNNKISDLSPLDSAGLTSLEELYVENNNITSLSPLVNITSLKKLSIQNDSATVGNNRITSLTALSNLTNLTHIWGANNAVTSLEGLANLTKLTEVYFENNKLTSIKGMSEKQNLAIFSVMHQDIKDLSPLADATNLTTLFIRDNEISDVSPLQKLTKLKAIYMENNQVYDLSTFENLTVLTEVYADNQIVILPVTSYTTLLTFKRDTIVVGRNSTLVPPSSISNNGIYSQPTISWSNLPKGTNEVSYSWSSTTSISKGRFSGQVIQPLRELETIDFKIQNEINNNPDTNQKITYYVKIIAENGEVIPPSANGLSSLSTDRDTGIFSLGDSESVTLQGLEGAHYELTTTIDTDIYNVHYTATHEDTIVSEALPNSKVITGTLLQEQNTLVITNEYKTLLTIKNEFVPTGSLTEATYDLVFTYPDGSNSGDTYTNLTISENQPFELFVLVGTTYTLTQRILEGYESTSTLVADGGTTETKIVAAGENHIVNGSIGMEENSVNFKNVTTQNVRVQASDTSKYPIDNQSFSFTLQLERTDQSEVTYSAKKFDTSGNETILTFTTNQTFELKDGEYIIFEALPSNLQLDIVQTGVVSYTTEVEATPSDGLTIADGILSEGATVNGVVGTLDKDIQFINQSDYQPPVTGISSNTQSFIAIVSIIAIVLVGLIGFFWFKLSLTNKR